MKEKYRPSNGTDGMWFEEKFCMQCRRCNPDPDKQPQCKILLRMLVYGTEEKEYPKQLIYDEKGNGICTSFEQHDWSKGRPKPKTHIGKRKVKGQSELF